MLFTTEWISAIFTDFKGAAKDPLPIHEVTSDSRIKLKRSLFIPLIGEKFDGHNHVKEAFNNGAIAILWDKKRELPRFLPTDFPVFFVQDTLLALQQLASAYRNEINPKVIGITGSNGKTTTKDLAASVLKTTFKTHHTEGNFNNHIGLPLTILSMARDTEMLVLEMGMNHYGEIEQLAKIARPDYSIITNIGESHMEYLGSREGIAKAKLEIASGMDGDGLFIIDGDEALLERVKDTYRTITCGFNSDNDVIIENVEVFPDKTHFQLADGSSYAIPLPGKHHAHNAAYTAALGVELGITQENIKQGLRVPKHTAMRFEMLKGPNGVSIINDAYNASPTSMKAAIEVVKQVVGFETKVLVLGDIFELGDQSKKWHESVAEAIDDGISVLFTLGKAAKFISDKAMERNKKVFCQHYTDKDLLLGAIKPYMRENALVLFKASRGMKFEALVEKIMQP